MVSSKPNAGRTIALVGIAGVVITAFAVWLAGRDTTAGILDDATAAAPAVPASSATPARVTDATHVRIEPSRADDPGREPETAAAPTLIVTARFKDDYAPRNVTVQIVDEHDRRSVASSQPKVVDGAIEAELRVPANIWLDVQLRADGAFAAGRSTKLRPGEVHRMAMECATRPTLLRLVGPSPKLMPRLEVIVLDLDATPSARLEVPFPPNGTTRCLLSGKPAIHIRTSVGDDIPVDGPDGHGLLRPKAQPLGIIVQQRGEPVRADLGFDRAPTSRRAESIWITSRQTALDAKTIWVRLPDGRTRHGPLAPLRRPDDIWILDLDLLQPLGQLDVTLAPMPTDDALVIADLTAVHLTEETRIDLNHGTSGARRQATVPAGVYRLVWRPRREREQLARELVRVEPGATTPLVLEPLTLAPWIVRVRNAESIPRATLHFERRIFGSLTETTLHGFSTAAPKIGQTATIRLQDGPETFAARFVAVDRAARVAEVETDLASATAVALQAANLAGGSYSHFYVFDPGSRTRARRVRGDTVRVARGRPLRGYVTQSVDHADQLVAWFSVSVATSELALPATGHWAEVALPADLLFPTLLLESADGVARIRVNSLRLAGPKSTTVRPHRYRLHIPTGTTKIHIDVNGERQTFAASLTEIVVR